MTSANEIPNTQNDLFVVGGESGGVKTAVVAELTGDALLPRLDDLRRRSFMRCILMDKSHLNVPVFASA